jgi:DNA-binding MarR family transcriptional regulator
MDATAQGRAMELLGRFNDELTRVFDGAFGTEWAEIEEMLAIATVVTDQFVTTRRLADITGFNRRAVSRMVARLRSEGLVITRPSDADKRAVEVVLTSRGGQRADALRTSIADFFRGSTEIAREISEGLGPVDAPPAPSVPAEPMDLLRRVCEAGVSLVHFMPDAATRGQLAARQRAALVQIATVGSVRPSDLSPSLHVSRAGVAYIVDQLCAKGFVIRRRGAVSEDQRAVVLEATPEGMQAVRAVMEGIEQQSDTLAHLFAEIALWRQPLAGADHPVRLSPPPSKTRGVDDGLHGSDGPMRWAPWGSNPRPAD